MIKDTSIGVAVYQPNHINYIISHLIGYKLFYPL